MKAFFLPVLISYQVCFFLYSGQGLWWSGDSEDGLHRLSDEKTYYFPDALIYEYEVEGKKEELWIYVNQKTRQLLFVPNDDMISGVISFPNGTYKVFGKTEKGKDTILTYTLPEITDEHLEWEGLKSLETVKTISQENIQQSDISSIGYQIDYQQMIGSEVIYVTHDIDINSHQLYGFCRLDGDAKLNIPLDFSGVLSKNQLITHIERSDFSMRLLNYGPNPYYFTYN